ncbi:MAG TPA: aminomethyl-transferring glycine dehydrogenase [Burkholderiales bacterium]|nr:aminomethyl-transferring glycine dehydrogenase [Burkholderiales bacterium]
MTDLSSSRELGQESVFSHRHIGPDEQERRAMLEVLGLRSMEELVDKAVPPVIRSKEPLKLASPLSEQQMLRELQAIASGNQVFKTFIGMGYYSCFTPPVILRNIIENPAWYTAYTPYQPEISQGRLEALLNFQTLVMDLTGLDIANASLLDEATAAAEAMVLCRRAAKNQSAAFFVSSDCHPQTIAVVQTRAKPLGIEIVLGDHRKDLEQSDVFGALLQYPASTGEIHHYAQVAAFAHERGALVVVAADLLSLTLLTPPGEFGADVALGSAQRFGVPLFYGGPHAAYFATRDAHKRFMPGRLVGVSIDNSGKPAYRLAMQTREQHIRREKATSNICTAQVLLAVVASMYAVYHGAEGLKSIAMRIHRLTAVLAEGLRRMGWNIPTRFFFDTFSVRAAGHAQEIHLAARENRVNLRRINETTVGISLDETTTEEDVRTLWRIFASCRPSDLSLAAIEAAAAECIPAALKRASPFLTHPVFRRHRSETEMLRYIRALGDKDIALDRAMIPLGSCTMKLNAASEMMPISWEAFSGIHPYAPAEQAQGYRKLISELEAMLCEVTGYDAVSLQPNAGSQGEFAGLLAIRAYHESRGEGRRRICLIPSSAHGTNPASASMAGLEVVVVRCDEGGNVDFADLKAKAEEHNENLAALMITYPSTHGVFEESIAAICALIHQHGGQVYLDGANLNALVGLAKPGQFGADVSHLNLHKTFCIPHGGGGPGVGPVAVRAHLAPFLPSLGVMQDEKVQAKVGPVSAAPWGSAGILPISYAFIRIMGAEGLLEATCTAILNANYVARRLASHYPVLYCGPNGMVAHECIIDLRPIKDATGITVADVAKRLIDFGFHAPTMSFPVAGTLMIEPTESESKSELDRFCDAMICIREEIQAVENGRMDPKDNLLKNAPHTAAMLTAERWTHPYSREQAAYPRPYLKQNKYWPPIGRVDDVYGDRHLVCACPPVSDYSPMAPADSTHPPKLT